MRYRDTAIAAVAGGVSGAVVAGAILWKAKNEIEGTIDSMEILSHSVDSKSNGHEGMEQIPLPDDIKEELDSADGDVNLDQMIQMAMEEIDMEGDVVTNIMSGMLGGMGGPGGEGGDPMAGFEGILDGDDDPLADDDFDYISPDKPAEGTEKYEEMHGEDDDEDDDAEAADE